VGVRIGVRWLLLCCVGRRRIWHGRWLDLSLWAGYKHGASLCSDARLSGHQRGVVYASGSLLARGLADAGIGGRRVMVAGSGVDSDSPVGNGLAPHSSGEVLGRVPVGLRVAAAIGWRLVVVLITVAALAWVISRVQFIVIPVAVAVLLAALLAPAVRLLSRFRWVPRGLATAVVVVGGLAVLSGVLYGLVMAFLAGLPALQAQLGQSFSQIRDWLARSPLHLSVPQLNNLGASIIQALGSSQAAMTSGALGVASTVGEIAASALLAIFTLIFFLYDGARIWEFVLRGIPQKSRDRVNVAGRRAFAALVSYTRAVTLVAATDALVVGLGLWGIGVPLVIPLAVLVFFGAFIPFVGAIVTGVIAVLIALVAKGLLAAVWVVMVLILVGELEGHVLQPLLLGRAVRLHPLAVVLPVATGFILIGVIGALLAVPVVAVVDAGIRSLYQPNPPNPNTVDPLNPRSART
jgi:putative heme transporter